MKPYTLYIVRHTQVNVQKEICYGQTDVDLSETFSVEQACIQEKTRHLVFSEIYSSPLKRCMQLATTWGNTVISDQRLMELHFGEWEGRNWNAIYHTPVGKAWFSDYLNTAGPGGESFRDMEKRVREFLIELPPAQGNILLITHDGVIRAILLILGFLKETELFKQPVPFGQLIKITENECCWM